MAVTGNDSGNGGNFERAVAWVNITFVKEDGTKMKSHKGIPIYASKVEDTDLQAMLKRNDGKLTVEYSYDEVNRPESDYNSF